MGLGGRLTRGGEEGVLYTRVCTYKPVRKNMCARACTYKSVRANLYTRVCTSKPVLTVLCTRVCTYKSVPTGLHACVRHLAWAWRIAVPKTTFFLFLHGVATESARVCTQPRHCVFIGYSSENAIPTNFQRVPPWPDGLY